jgi:hypothetical protein
LDKSRTDGVVNGYGGSIRLAATYPNWLEKLAITSKEQPKQNPANLLQQKRL